MERGEFVVRRRNGRESVLTGSRLASVSTGTPDKVFWLELKLYRSDRSGDFWLETVGRATEGEGEDRYRLASAPNAQVLFAKLLTQRDGEPFLSGPARDLLLEAAQHDEQIREALEFHWFPEHL